MTNFLRYLEAERRNQVRTRNQRLAALHSFFEYAASRVPEMMAVAERVAAIPTKRTPLNETRFLDRDELSALFAGLPAAGTSASRDRALLLFLYNTGARVQEVADLTVANLELNSPSRVHLHGKGDNWRSCPLWEETAAQLRALIAARKSDDASDPVFVSRAGQPILESTRSCVAEPGRSMLRNLPPVAASSPRMTRQRNVEGASQVTDEATKTRQSLIFLVQ